MGLGKFFLKLHLVKLDALAWYSVMIRVIFGVRFDRRKVDKKQTYMNKYKLYDGHCWIFLPNVIKIYPYNFELYDCKVYAFFLRHSVYYSAAAETRQMQVEHIQMIQIHPRTLQYAKMHIHIEMTALFSTTNSKKVITYSIRNLPSHVTMN